MHTHTWIFPGGSDGKESACNAGDQGLIPGLGGSSEEGNGYPLQYSCLENSMDRGAWWAIVSGVAGSDMAEQLPVYAICYIAYRKCSCVHARSGAPVVPSPSRPRGPWPTGPCVHGILQARELEWAAVPSLGGSSRCRERTCVPRLLHWQPGYLLVPPGKPWDNLNIRE